MLLEPAPGLVVRVDPRRALALSAPLVLRRRAPFAVFLAIAGVALAQWIADVGVLADMALLVAIYTVAVHEPRGRVLAAAVVLELGILPADTVLPPRNSEDGDDVVAWDELPADKQQLFAKYMAVYAAMVDNIDQQFGRLCAELEALGELDNTIFLFTSDNGASREGEAEGTTAYYSHLLGTVDTDADLARMARDGS